MSDHSEWIPHDGGPCPVDPETVVWPRFSNGLAHSPSDAKNWRWSWGFMGKRGGDIIAYQIISAATQADARPSAEAEVPTPIGGGVEEYGATGEHPVSAPPLAAWPTDEDVERVARAIHVARFGWQCTPTEFGDPSDVEYCTRLARAALLAARGGG
jgi:hypothetical protein